VLKISYFQTDIHTETFAPLITCVTDDTDGEKCSSGSTMLMTSMNSINQSIKIYFLSN